MGNGSSLLDINQEKFVEKNYNLYKKQLSNYNEFQIKNKLRQLYYNKDKDFENEWLSIAVNIPAEFKTTFWNKDKGYLCDYAHGT